MGGVGQQFLPHPAFSPENPYWFNPAERYPFLHHDYRPRPTAKDFLYATNWEIWRRDTHMANCVRIATQRTVNLNWQMGIRRQLQIMRLTQKEITSAKTD